MCLQSILEGKGVFLKKIGKWVTPADGFTVIATANTKGKGSDDGRFIGTNVLNEAFLERFPVTFEQSYPSPATEAKILSKLCDDDQFTSRLVDWADIIRKTFYDGGVDEVISTRRLVHIARAFSIWKDRQKAIQVCLNRFDDETKAAFMDLYDKVDADVDFSGQTDDGMVE
jgi:MoxR-like ATPase